MMNNGTHENPHTDQGSRQNPCNSWNPLELHTLIIIEFHQNIVLTLNCSMF
jgi:hypothetical protein